MMANMVCDGEVNLAKSIVMQLVRCATGGLKREAVMQSGKDRDAGHTMEEASRKGIMRNRKRKQVTDY